MEFLVEMGLRIKQLRQKLNLTQEELAQKAGYTSRSSINKIEKGLVDLPQSKIADIAKALGTTPAYLMGWEESHDSKEAYQQLAETYAAVNKKIDQAINNTGLRGIRPSGGLRSATYPIQGKQIVKSEEDPNSFKGMEIIPLRRVNDGQEEVLLRAFRGTTDEGRLRIIQAVLNICDSIKETEKEAPIGQLVFPKARFEFKRAPKRNSQSKFKAKKSEIS